MHCMAADHPPRGEHLFIRLHSLSRRTSLLGVDVQGVETPSLHFPPLLRYN
jgi:hypothetical protein